MSRPETAEETLIPFIEGWFVGADIDGNARQLALDVIETLREQELLSDSVSDERLIEIRNKDSLSNDDE